LSETPDGVSQKIPAAPAAREGKGVGGKGIPAPPPLPKGFGPCIGIIQVFP